MKGHAVYLTRAKFAHYARRIGDHHWGLENTMSYEKPQVREIGSVRELTLQTFNKIGALPDAFTVITGGAVIGSLVFAMP
jgi:hypothetical protein